MQIRMRYFAALREVTGREAERLELPEGASIATARDELLARYPALGPVLPRCAVARNQAYVDAETALADGDELAFIPPVGGG